MKRLLLFFFVIISLQLMAVPVSEPSAQQVALNFYTGQIGTAPNDLTLVDQYHTVLTNRPVYYIYQVDGNKGFVIVAGDDQSYPIIGYALKGKYIVNDQAEHYYKWVMKYRQEIMYIIENDLPATPEITAAWTKLINNESIETFSNSNRAVNPLMTLGWDQGNFYNALCPMNSQANQRTVTGCVATAMAMVMKYWNYPTQGTGFSSYNTQQYGTLSANYGNTTYDYASMPNQVTSANNAVATLMYHCGVAVEMTYGIAQSGGSSAYVCIGASPANSPCSEIAYEQYFGFDSGLQGVIKQNYSDANWISTLKAELDAQRIIQYAGIGSGGGHTWICDGYDNNNFFHMNWGWSNSQNGFFNLTALNPGSLGTGGGTGGYNSTQQAIIGIKPPNGGGQLVQPGNLALQSSMSVSPNPIDFLGSFTVTANIKNTTNSVFQGDIAAALFTQDNTLIDIINSYTNVSIAANGTSGNLPFYTAGMIATPGNYQISLFFRPTGGNWTAISPATFSNPIPLTINSLFNYMQLTQAVTYTPANPVAGQNLSVTTNIGNAGFFDYFGTYYAVLYDLQGNFVTTIGQLSENQGLPVGFQYSPPFLTFQTNNLNVSPGSYLLAILEEQQGFSPFFVGGGTGNFANPLTIKVAAPPPPPDQYEANDTPSQAALLPANFNGNSATISTSGSNIHVGSDYDFYYIDLPVGFNYTLNAALQDAGNTTTFTVDALFGFDIGQGLSDAFDTQMPSSLAIQGGGVQVLFLVSPLYTGSIGTYQLNIQLQRSPVASNENIEETNLISLFPNPAQSEVYYNISEPVMLISLTDLSGKVIKTEKINPINGLGKIDIEELPNGIYLVELMGKDKKWHSKLIKTN